MAECREGHNHVVGGHLVIRWCPECGVFELRVWVSDGFRDGAVHVLTPEWAGLVRLQDDEWTERTLNKYVRSLAAVVRQFETDERLGVARLL